MGRYETLNSNTKDLVNCMLPGIAAMFEIEDAVETIPEDIRMRKWDCDRRDHIKAEPENDPRNWGVQLLKDLVTVSRLKQGQLKEFHADLRAQLAISMANDPNHPWVRLADIKELKQRYEKPDGPDGDSDAEEQEEESSDDEYQHEELVDLDTPRKRGRRPNAEKDKERVRAQPVENRKGRKIKRLRRDSSVGWERPGNHQPRGLGQSEDNSHGSVIYPEVLGDDEYEDMSVEELQVNLQVAEAELRTARMKASLMAKQRKASTVQRPEPGQSGNGASGAHGFNFDDFED